MLIVYLSSASSLTFYFRYANMDYIFWSTLYGYGYEGTPVVVSYDIVCQWHINLLSRFADLPDELRGDIDRFIIKFVIPKFHISAHGDKCQSLYSLNLRRRMARTDGENIERGWAHMNPASLSTREMGPGARRDTLDCQWSGWNWRLLVRLGTCICLSNVCVQIDVNFYRWQYSSPAL